MPSERTLEAFMSQVEAGDFVGALEAYYHPDAQTQENGQAPRVGLETLIGAERMVMAGCKTIAAQRLAPPLANGDLVAIRWRFEFTPHAGDPRVLEEVAFQTWRGERIAEEKFFYDPAQLGR